MSSKYEFEVAVFASDLEPCDRIILLAYAHRCDFETGQNVRSSQNEVAKRAGYVREFVNKRTKALVKAGWLIVTSQGKGKPTVYALAVPGEIEIAPGVCTIEAHKNGPEFTGSECDGQHEPVKAPVTVEAQGSELQEGEGVNMSSQGCDHEFTQYNSIELTTHNLEEEENMEEENQGADAPVETDEVSFSEILNPDGTLYEHDEGIRVVDDWGLTETIIKFPNSKDVDDSPNSVETQDSLNSIEPVPLCEELDRLRRAAGYQADKYDWQQAQRLFDDPTFKPDREPIARAAHARDMTLPEPGDSKW